MAVGLCAWQPATHPGVHPLQVSGVGIQATDGGVRPPRRFVFVHPGIQATYQGARPPGVSVVGTQSANLHAASRALGECWGYLSHVHSKGLRGEGRQWLWLLWSVL